MLTGLPGVSFCTAVFGGVVPPFGYSAVFRVFLIGLFDYRSTIPITNCVLVCVQIGPAGGGMIRSGQMSICEEI